MKFVAPAGATQISREQDIFPVENGFVNLPKSLGLELGLEAAPTAATKAAPAGAASEGVPGNADAAKATIAAAATLADLDALQALELGRKDPRVSVVRAIDDRRVALTTAK